MEPAIPADSNEKLFTEKINNLKDNLNAVLSNLEIKINNIEREKEKEIKELKNVISKCMLDMKQMNETIVNLEKKNEYLEKEIIMLKYKNPGELSNKKKIFDDMGIKTPLGQNEPLINNFEEIENPWMNEKKYYILENNDNLAILNNAFQMYPIKSKYKFDKNKIYKLIFNISYISGKFRVGFGDFGLNNKQLKEKGSVGLTNDGLYIEGEKISNIKIEKENKEIIFLINLKNKQKYFVIYIDGKSLGLYNFNFDNIYGLASMHNGLVEIKTLRCLEQ